MENEWKTMEVLRRSKYPIEYELKPSKIDVGSNWITLKLKRIDEEN